MAVDILTFCLTILIEINFTGLKSSGMSFQMIYETKFDIVLIFDLFLSFLISAIEDLI